MSSPDGWRRVTFGEVVRNVSESVPDPRAANLERAIGLEHLEPGELAITRWASTGDGLTFTRRFQAGQVLFGRRRVYQRKAAVPDFDGVCSGDIYVLEPTNGALLRELLPFIVQSEPFYEYALRTSAGSLSPRTKWTDLKNYQFDLPPIDEQHEIAELLWATERLRRATLGLRRSAELALTSRLLADLSAGGNGIDLVPVEQLVLEGPRNGFSAQSNDQGRGVKTLAIGAIRGGKVVIRGSTKYAEVDQTVLSSFPLRRDDVLVVRGNGNKLLTGRAGIVERDLDGYIYPDLLIKLRFDVRLIDPRFACVVWNLPHVHRALLRRAKSTNGIWKINGKDIKQHVIPVPPLWEQSQILSRLAVLEDAVQAAASQHERSSAVFHQLISHLLRPHGVH